MKHLLKLVIGTFLAVSIFPLPQAATVESEEERELRALCETYSSAYKAKDASAMASQFAGRNVVLMPPNEAAAVGPEAIKGRYQAFFQKSGSKPTGAENLEVGGDLRDWAHVGDLLVITASNNTYKYVAVLVHQPDKAWRIARLIWNASQ